jgi:Na+-driven multidrug efflux pump
MIKKSLCTAALVCVLNICLALTIPFKTSFGYSGIAIATVISLFIGAIFNIFYVTKLFIPKFSFSFPLIKKIMNISWPFGLLQIIWQLASMVLFFILNALPKNNIEVIAAFTNGLKIESAIFLPAFAFNMANSVIVGNFIGEKKKKDAYHAGIVTAFIGVLIVLFLTLMVMFNAKRIAAFLSDNSTVVRESMKYIYISLMFEPFMAWGIILGGGLNGAGDTRSVMLAVALSLWCIRIPLAFLLGVHTTLGAIGVWWAMNASIFAQTAFISWRYLAKKWLVSAQQLLSE